MDAREVCYCETCNTPTGYDPFVRVCARCDADAHEADQDYQEWIERMAAEAQRAADAR